MQNKFFSRCCLHTKLSFAMNNSTRLFPSCCKGMIPNLSCKLSNRYVMLFTPPKTIPYFGLLQISRSFLVSRLQSPLGKESLFRRASLQVVPNTGQVSHIHRNDKALAFGMNCFCHKSWRHVFCCISMNQEHIYLFHLLD